MRIVRVAEIPWEDRVNVDGWPSRGGMYCNDIANALCIRLIDYPYGSTEPRHVHPGTHATTVLRNRAIVDGLTLEPLDVIVGPSHEPHGPLHYPEGCKLLSAFLGSYYHSEVAELKSDKHYRLVQQATLPWHAEADGVESKTLVDRGCGRLLVRVLRCLPGATVPVMQPQLHSALVIRGPVEAGGETLGEWDFIWFDEGAGAEPVSLPAGGELLTISLQ